MLTAPDFAKKQIAFVDTSSMGDCDLSFRNENIVITDREGTRDKVPLQLLVAIFLHGQTTLTTKLIEECSKHGVSLFLLSRSMKIYASVCPYAEGNYLLRQRQYALSPEEELRIAQNIVANKIENQLALLRSVDRKTIGEKTLLAYKREVKEKIAFARDIATLRGIEGTAGRMFFGSYFGTIDWYKRQPRAKSDENNILLDMGYSYLFNMCDSLLRLFGFDTYKGVYHQLFFQRKSLACDVMEPFRCVIDRTLLKMHTLGRFDKNDFFVRNGMVGLSYQKNAKYSRMFLDALMKNKNELYEYVRGYYYHVLNGDEEFPKFSIR